MSDLKQTTTFPCTRVLYCPECGCEEAVIPENKPPECRVCVDCGCEWYTDITYPGGNRD